MTAVHKRRADALAALRLRALARELDVAWPDGAEAALVVDAPWRERAALHAYGHDLVARVDGFGDGPAALALWRRFAWSPSGSPRKGLVLTAEVILAAEAALVVEMRRGAVGPPG